MTARSHLAKKLLIGLSAAALMAVPAKADKLHPNIFELLFGGPQYQQHGQQPWWQTPGGKNGHYGAEPSADPQLTLPGLGMGTVDYMPPLVVPLFDPTFATLKGDTPEAEQIRQLLSDKADPVRAQDVERKAVLAFYKAGNFKPQWFDGGHLTSKANDVLKLLAASADEGFVPKNYLPEVLPSFENAEASVGDDAAKQARLDVGLTVAVLHYARHMAAGQFEPNRLSLYNDMKPDAGNPDDTLKAVFASVDPIAYLKELAPKHPQYTVLKEALAKLGPGQVFEKIPAGANLKAGKSDARVVLVRQRLNQLGYPTAGDQSASTKLDQDLVINLMAYQTAMKMKPSGILDAATVKALNNDENAERREKLIASLERLRWLPRTLGDRYVFVNQAAFDVHVMDHDKIAWVSKVIVGQPDKQTYAFYDKIKTVVFNPKWGVPPSIIINEYAPKMRRDPGYLTRNGFIVTDLNGNEIDPGSVDWWNISASPSFGVQQLAGGDNALGELKFLFPNAHDIYMHDTPTKNLFKQDVRDFSHGCVRVENPREFAQVLLGWSKDQIEKGLAISDTHSVDLPVKVPVYLTYFTAWVDDKGEVVYHDDIYGRDAAIAKAMNYNPNARSSLPNVAQGGVVSGGLIKN